MVEKKEKTWKELKKKKYINKQNPETIETISKEKKTEKKNPKQMMEKCIFSD